MALQYASSSSSDPDAYSSFGFFKEDKDHSGTGVHSGYGYGHHEKGCCNLVVDLLCLLAIISSIAGAALLLARVMEIELTMVRRRRKKRSLPYKSCVLEGKLSNTVLLGYKVHGCKVITDVRSSWI